MALVAFSRKFLLVFGPILALSLQTGCGVKTEPVPYLSAYPERAPKQETATAPNAAKQPEDTKR